MTPLSKRKTNKMPVLYGSAGGFNGDNGFVFSFEIPISKYRDKKDYNRVKVSRGGEKEKTI